MSNISLFSKTLGRKLENFTLFLVFIPYIAPARQKQKNVIDIFVILKAITILIPVTTFIITITNFSTITIIVIIYRTITLTRNIECTECIGAIIDKGLSGQGCAVRWLVGGQSATPIFKCIF